MGEWRGGGEGEVLRSIALMMATIWSLVIFWSYPHLRGVARIRIPFFQYGRRTVKRGVAKLYWPV